MKIRVQMMGQLRGIVRGEEEDFELPDEATVHDAVVAIAALHESSRTQFVTEQGNIRSSMLLVVNDSALPTSQATKFKLHDQDQLTILPPISGG
jgi:molybdopterin converting factor small subunit